MIHATSIAEVVVAALALSSNNFKATPCTRICRYNKDFFDGQVCIGCFRDAAEISTWSQLTNVEKGFALEDAADRCGSRGNTFEGAIDADELRQQAQSWFDLDNAVKNGSGKILVITKSPKPKHEENDEATKKVHIGSENDKNIDNLHTPSPCEGECQFDDAFFDGEVCGKCFRDKFEAENWDKFSREQQMIALQDMAERLRQSQ